MTYAVVFDNYVNVDLIDGVYVEELRSPCANTCSEHTKHPVSGWYVRLVSEGSDLWKIGFDERQFADRVSAEACAAEIREHMGTARVQSVPLDLTPPGSPERIEKHRDTMSAHLVSAISRSELFYNGTWWFSLHVYGYELDVGMGELYAHYGTEKERDEAWQEMIGRHQSAMQTYLAGSEVGAPQARRTASW